MKKTFKKKILYLSNNGIMESLGNSQILSYLLSLSDTYEFYLLTNEKKESYKKNLFYNKNKFLKDNNIRWFPIMYVSYNNFLYLFFLLINFIKINYIILTNKVDLIHIRSFVPGIYIYFISFFIKKKFIYDIRGFWINEKIDRLNYKKNILFKFFDHVNNYLLLNSQNNIFITNQSKQMISKKFPNTVFKNILITTASSKKKFKLQIDKANNDKINLLYLGTTDGAYDFFKIINLFKFLLNQDLNFHLTVLSNDNKNRVNKFFSNKNISNYHYEIKTIDYDKIQFEITKYDFMIFYCKESLSIKASMPTKIGESLLSGIPLICNNFNNDIYQIFNTNDIGLLTDFSTEKYFQIYNKIIKMKKDIGLPLRCRLVGEELFSLDNAVKKLNNLYSI